MIRASTDGKREENKIPLGILRVRLVVIVVVVVVGDEKRKAASAFLLIIISRYHSSARLRSHSFIHSFIQDRL